MSSGKKQGKILCFDIAYVQFVASILKDKLSENLKKPEYYIVELSQDDKLLRIENGMN